MGMMKEYVIWGIPKGGTDDTLLLAKIEGKEIRDKGLAKRMVKLLEDKYGATKVRIQEIDMNGNFNWLKEIGL